MSPRQLRHPGEMRWETRLLGMVTVMLVVFGVAATYGAASLVTLQGKNAGLGFALRQLSGAAMGGILLLLASRLENARDSKPGAANLRAFALWDRIVKRYAKSPEAPEALLNSARQLTINGDKAGAATRYESLLIDYPESALVPQGRRELEKLKGGGL